MDIFLEYLVKKKNTVKDFAFIIGICLLGALLTYLIIAIMFSVLNLGTVGFILIFGIWFGVYWLLSSHSREFEYSLTNGEMDIDTIIARRKRKHLLTIKTRQIDLCANVHDPEYQHELQKKDNLRRTVMAASLPDAKRTCFIDTTVESKRYRVFMEPTAKMLDTMKKYNPQNIHIYALAEDEDLS